MTERTAENCIASSVLDRLIAAHDGDVALLWLYCQRHGALDEEQAAQALCRTLQEIRAAEEKLLRHGSFPLAHLRKINRIFPTGEHYTIKIILSQGGEM